MLQIISLILENKPGALMRVTGLLTQRGYNIESLTVARTLDPELSRMTIVVDVDSLQRAQVIKQMNKLINVLQANDLTEGPSVIRELVLLRIKTAQESRTAVLKEAEIFGGRVVDSSTARSSRTKLTASIRGRPAAASLLTSSARNEGASVSGSF